MDFWMDESEKKQDFSGEEIATLTILHILLILRECILQKPNFSDSPSAQAVREM